MGALLSILPMLSSAIDVVGKFTGSAQAAKVTGYVQDAVGVINALTPLVTQFASGKEVTPEDVRAALAGKDAALSEFDELIKAKDGA